MRRQLAVELGGRGVRVVTLSSGGIPETIPDDVEGRDEIHDMIAAETLTGRPATLDDVGRAAVFAASDWGRSMTAATLNISAGALID